MRTDTAASGAVVVCRDGFRARLAGPPDNGRAELALPDGRRLVVPAELLRREEEGVWSLPLTEEDLRRGEARRTVQETRVPIAEERLRVGKRRVQTGGVRVRKRVVETVEEIDEPLKREDVDVERVDVNEFVDEVPEPRQEDDTLIIPLVEEVLVIDKKLILREEIRITRRAETHREPIRARLRREEADVERLDGEE